jgi:UDP-3-O-[3-hydroxymyristoyl] N-acetylglucosamine deacetylase
MLWCEAFAEAGISGTPPLRPVLTAPVLVTGNHGAFLAAYPAERLTITVAMHYDHPLLGTQVARFTDGDDYATQIAPARTFGLIEEVEALRKAGLAKGGSIENAVVVYPDHFSSPLRFDNEMARHKLLDVMGDLFVAGPLPHADIIAVKPGHRLNARFANDLQMVTRYPS